MKYSDLNLTFTVKQLIEATPACDYGFFVRLMTDAGHLNAGAQPPVYCSSYEPHVISAPGALRQFKDVLDTTITLRQAIRAILKDGEGPELRWLWANMTHLHEPLIKAAAPSIYPVDVLIETYEQEEEDRNVLKYINLHALGLRKAHRDSVKNNGSLEWLQQAHGTKVEKRAWEITMLHREFGNLHVIASRGGGYRFYAQTTREDVVRVHRTDEEFNLTFNCDCEVTDVITALKEFRP